MDNGNFGTQDILTGRGLGLGGFGGYNYGHGAFASPSSNAVRINAGNRATAAGIENLLDQNQFAATNKNIVDGDARICDKLSDSEFRTSAGQVAITKDLTDSEFRAIARENALRSEAVANNIAAIERAHRAEIKNLECCCKTEATALAIETRNIQRALDTAERELQTQKILTTCGCGCGGGVRPCPPV